MKFGYARVSTADQNLDRQIDALREAGAERVFMDKASGKSLKRPQLEELLGHLRPGDVVVVSELSRLGRSTKDLIELADRFNESGVDLVSLKEQIDTSSPMGRCFFTVLAAVATMERELIVERTNEGLAAARARGRVGGRPGVPKERLDAAVALYEAGLKISEIQAATGVGRAVLYRALEARGVPRRVDKHREN